ncbi:type VII secretion protein EccE [Streptomyces oceani]|uniref:Type VII secretion protein EccE n=1 Tax=Streptomyces oceani TaxID=1075402 RepID=A0A1E7JTW0_9ACTN|nr:type VII secretion protein EccE [Streptomyces oceani]
MQQLVLIELALAVLVVGAAIDGLMLVPAVVLAAALLVFALLRRRQRSIRDWLTTRLALRARRQQAALPPAERTDAGLAPAVECVPGLRTYAFVDRDRRTIGMLGDGSFLTAILRVEAGVTALRPAFGTRALPLELLHDALEVDGIRLESVQLVQHVQPAPAPHLPEQAVARRSYAPLQDQASSPALRLTWVALKLDGELCREAVEARGGGLRGAQRCLLRATDQLASRLTGAGFRAAVLNEEELVSAVATSACVSPTATARASQPDAPPGRRTAESARAWRCDDRWHTTYAVSRWPELGRAATPLPRLVSLLTAVPALTSTFSLTLARGPRRKAVSVTGHVRVTGRSDTELTGAREHLERAARSARVSLARLDREQLPGIVATLPLGGAN